MNSFCVNLLSKMKIIVACFAALYSLTVVQGGRIGCWYGSWSIYYPGDEKFQIEYIDVQHCTHIFYAYAGINSRTYEIEVLDPYNDLESGLNGFKRFTGLVAQNPNLVPMLSVGGWNEGSEKYSAMAASNDTRDAFINSVLVLLDNYGFKGLELAWEYPTQRGGQPEDKQNLVLLLQGLRSAFSYRGLVLAISASVDTEVVNSGYDIPSIMQFVDFVNLQSFYYHSNDYFYTAHGEPLHARADENPKLSLNSSVHFWLNAGASPDKLNFGLVASGNTYILSDPTSNGPHAAASGPGYHGDLYYYQICLNNWSAVVEPTWAAPYAFSGYQWVSYDDASSIETKCSWSKSLGLGGAWLDSLEADDFRNLCGKGAYPLLTSLFNNC